MKFLEIFDKPIAFHRGFVAITGSIEAALLLSQAVYWSKRTKDENGWFWKTATEWEEETGITRYGLETARKRLVGLGFMEENLRGIPAKMWYRVDAEAVFNAIEHGSTKALTVEEIIELYSPTLNRLSNAAYIRAQKAGVEAHPVSYIDVLRAKGNTCHVCGDPITKGVGQKDQYLSFDHIHPILAGGAHSFDNIAPVHARCNAEKSDEYQFVVSGQTSSLLPDKQVGGSRTNKPVVPGQAIYTENTTENTTKTTAETLGKKTESKRAKAAKEKRLQTLEALGGDLVSKLQKLKLKAERADKESSVRQMEDAYNSLVDSIGDLITELGREKTVERLNYALGIFLEPTKLLKVQPALSQYRFFLAHDSGRFAHPSPTPQDAPPPPSASRGPGKLEVRSIKTNTGSETWEVEVFEDGSRPRLVRQVG